MYIIKFSWYKKYHAHNLHYTEYNQFGDIVNKSILNLTKEIL